MRQTDLSLEAGNSHSKRIDSWCFQSKPLQSMPLDVQRQTQSILLEEAYCVAPLFSLISPVQLTCEMDRRASSSFSESELVDAWLD